MVKILKKARLFIPLERINNNIGYYTPKKNKVKLFGLVGFVVLCLVTPLTNWLILVSGKILNKFPLWIYK